MAATEGNWGARSSLLRDKKPGGPNPTYLPYLPQHPATSWAGIERKQIYSESDVLQAVISWRILGQTVHPPRMWLACSSSLLSSPLSRKPAS